MTNIDKLVSWHHEHGGFCGGSIYFDNGKAQPLQLPEYHNFVADVVESILLYGSHPWALNKALSKKLDGTYKRMLRVVYNVSWKQQLTNKSLYGKITKISSVVKYRRLALAGHVYRHEEPASKLHLWTPDEQRRVGRPAVTLRTFLLEDTNLYIEDLPKVMKDRDF